jgi:hypothetical protein
MHAIDGKEVLVTPPNGAMVAGIWEGAMCIYEWYQSKDPIVSGERIESGRPSLAVQAMRRGAGMV